MGAARMLSEGQPEDLLTDLTFKPFEHISAAALELCVETQKSPQTVFRLLPLE
jgi:hypothetical protein